MMFRSIILILVTMIMACENKPTPLISGYRGAKGHAIEIYKGPIAIDQV